MNITPFAALESGISYFWMIAVPVAAVVTLFMMRITLYRWIVRLIQRRGISRSRRGRLRREQRSL